MKWIIVLLILLTSCSFKNYTSDMKLRYPQGEIYMINGQEFLVMRSGSVYYIKYFKGEVYIDELIKLPSDEPSKP